MKIIVTCEAFHSILLIQSGICQRGGFLRHAQLREEYGFALFESQELAKRCRSDYFFDDRAFVRVGNRSDDSFSFKMK